MAAASSLFTGPLEGYAGKMRSGPAPQAVAARALADPATLRPLLELFASAWPGAPWQPACSMWSQWYFGTLTVPALASILGPDPAPSLALGDVCVSFCAVKAVPLAFHTTGPAPDGTPTLVPLLRDHFGPVIEALCATGGLSANLLWENLTWPLCWTLRELVAQHPGLKPAVSALLDAPGLGAKPRRVLDKARAVALQEAPFTRRLCCLRDRMPGQVNCGSSFCPRSA